DPVKNAAKAHVRAGSDGRSLNHEGWDQVFGPLAEIFRRADVSVVNLETPLVATDRPMRGPLTFSAPPQMALGLAANGVTLATFANNHCQDQKLDGIVETRAHLAEAWLVSVGADADGSRAGGAGR